MFSTVVVPLDLTPEAEVAIPHATTIARQAGASLQLLTISPPYRTLDTARRSMQEIAGRHNVEADVTASVTSADSGEPAAAILATADTADTLICLRTHARRPLTEMALGSVSEEVMRSCSNPVLLVGPKCGPAPEQVASMVVALDGSDRAESILPTVADWATNLKITPWLFQVLAPDLPSVTAGSGDIHETSYLRRVAARLDQDGVRAEWDVLHHRTPAAAIVEAAEANRPSVIALTTRGRSGYGRLVLGSVALQVAHRATVPVLVVRPSET